MDCEDAGIQGRHDDESPLNLLLLLVASFLFAVASERDPGPPESGPCIVRSRRNLETKIDDKAGASLSLMNNLTLLCFV